MAKTGKIDPAFQAAPFLGTSTHDPIEFTRRHKLAKFQAQKARQEEEAKRTAKGLSDLMVDVKSWEDQEGFKEITQDQDKIMKGFIDLSQKGMNLVSPSATEEVMAYKAITDAHNKLKQKVDIWNEQKGLYDVFQKAIEADAAKPESEQRIDHEKTYERIQGVLKTSKILDRKEFQNLLVKKPEIGDAHKYVRENLAFIAKPDVVTVPETDPATGQVIQRQREVMTPEKEKQKVQDLKNLFKTAPEPVKTAVKLQREKDEDLGVMTDEDYFVSMYDPTFKQKMIDTIKGTGGGISFNFLGSKTQMSPGTLRKEPLTYGTKIYTSAYEFALTKPVRVPLGAAGSTMFTGNEWVPLTGGGDVEATLSFYDSNADEFIFRTTQAGIAPFAMNNMTIAVPRSVIGEQADNLPIMVDGQLKKLKDVYGSMKEPEVRTIGGKDFRATTPYIPKKN